MKLMVDVNIEDEEEDLDDEEKKMMMMMRLHIKVLIGGCLLFSCIKNLL